MALLIAGSQVISTFLQLARNFSIGLYFIMELP